MDRAWDESGGDEMSSAGMAAGAQAQSDPQIEMDMPSMGGALSIVGGQMTPEGGQKHVQKGGQEKYNIFESQKCPN